MPYTYLIGWSKINQYYYGCRYAKNCDPSDLWVKYFTSSLYVKKLKEEHGDPDVIQIRKVFNSMDECIEYETRVLKRIVKRKHFINKNVAGAIKTGNPNPRSLKQREVARELMYKNNLKGDWYTDGIHMKRFDPGEVPLNWYKGSPESYKKKISNTLSEFYANKLWYNNGLIRKKFKAEEVPAGWVRGWKF